MSKFLALIMLAAMALFIAGPAMAQDANAWTVSKSYTFDKENTVRGDTEVNVRKDVDISVDGNLDATGGIEVQGDVVFKEMDVQVQDEEVVNKFFELDDSANSRWTVLGEGVMNAAEQLQNGLGNFANISQNPNGSPLDQMNVGLQYQVGEFNTALITQGPAAPNGSDAPTNSFAKQIQIGGGNTAEILQFIGEVPDPFGL